MALQSFQAFWDALPDRAASFLAAAVAVLVALLVSRTLKRVLRDLEGAGHLGPQMASRLQHVRRWGLGAITLLLVLQATGLFAYAWALLSAILAAIAIGFFAAWSILSNATSALILLTFRPFRVGDRILLVEPTTGTTFTGIVSDMNLVYTVLIDRDEETGEVSTLNIPNNLFMQKLVRTLGPVRESQVSPPPFFEASQPPRARGGDSAAR